MTDPRDIPSRPEPRGGGCLVAAGLLGGATIGVMLGEGSIGILAGLAIGAVAALALLWLDGRRRRS
jgi:hypothetical protein